MKQVVILAVMLLSFCLADSQVTIANQKPVTSKVTDIKPAYKQVAFRMLPFSGNVTFPANASSATGTDLNLTVKEFDLGKDISGSSFTVPETAIYHLDVRLTINFPITDYKNYLRFYLMLNNKETTFEKTVLMSPETDKTAWHTLAISTTVMLNKGDVISASFNADADGRDKTVSASNLSFSGFKVANLGETSGNTGIIR